MGGDEIHAARGRFAPGEMIGRAGDAGGDFTDHAGVSAPEFSRRVAETVVPFAPGGGKGAEPVAARPEVPGLGDEFQIPQDRVLVDRRQQRRMRVETFGAAGKGGGEVETEAVHPAVKRPNAQGVHGEAQDGGMVEPQDVAAAGVIDISGGVGGIEPVESRVVEAAQRDGRAVGVALAAVVQHHVDQDLESGVLQGGDAFAHFAPAARREPRVGRAKGDRIIAPVIGQARRAQMALIHPGGAGRQLQGGHAKLSQVGQSRRMGEAGEGSAQILRQVVEHAGKTAHMQFLDDGFRPGNPAAMGPRQGGGGGDGLGRERSAVGFGVEQRIVQPDRAVEREGERIEQQFVGIEALALLRPPRPVGAQAIAYASAQVRREAVKNRPGSSRQSEAGKLAAAARIEQAQFDLLRGLGIDRDIGAASDEPQSKGLGRAGKELFRNQDRRDLAIERRIILGGDRPADIGLQAVELDLLPGGLARIERGAAAQGPGERLRGDGRKLQAGGAIGLDRHFIGVDDGIGQSPDPRHHRHGAVAHGAKLGQAAGLETRGHENGVRPRLN